MQEFDFTNIDTNCDLSEVAEHLSKEESLSVLATLTEMKENEKSVAAEDFKSWFDSAFLPILKDFAFTTMSLLEVDQDAMGDITATLTSRYGFDISVTQKRMHLVLSAADHITVSKCSGSDDVKVTLIFGLPEAEK